MLKQITFLSLAALMGLALAGCDVNVEDEGKLPDVDVEVEEGRMPEVDVRGPDVEVDTEPVEVPVPDVDVETDPVEVQVPDVDVDLPNDAEGEN